MNDQEILTLFNRRDESAIDAARAAYEKALPLHRPAYPAGSAGCRGMRQ